MRGQGTRTTRRSASLKASADKSGTSPDNAKAADTSAGKARTPNAERSAATRAKILNATIDCLNEVGYHSTSTVLVTERAGVSRGAMLHHFPSKSELILETFAHIRHMRADAHSEALALLKSDRERFLYLIDALWTTFQTPAGVARLEIMIGGRCDPEVAPAFGQQHQRYLDKHLERVHGLLQAMPIRDKKKVDAFAMLYIAAMRGLVIETFYPSTRADVDVKAAIALMKEFQVDMLDKLLAE
jgi:AcrR family transcriptional regulator